MLNYFFFFQAEDGIRDATVTGVQTCALPICAEQRILRVRGTIPSLESRGNPAVLPSYRRRRVWEAAGKQGSPESAYETSNQHREPTAKRSRMQTDLPVALVTPVPCRPSVASERQTRRAPRGGMLRTASVDAMAAHEL